MVLRIAICDDELSQTQILSEYVDALSPKYSGFYIQYDIYRDGNELITYYKRTERLAYYDIILLDVEMRDSNGIQTALKLRDFDRKALFIYITDYPQYINDAADTDMFRYLIKPVVQEKFNKAFDDAFKTIEAKGKTFSYTSNYNHYRVFAKDIIYFEKVGKNVIMHTKSETHNFRHQIGLLYNELKQYGFAMVHNSILVNMAYVCEVKRTYLTLHDRTQLPISNAHSKEVKNLFVQYEFGRCDL